MTIRCCGLALISTALLFAQDRGAARPRGNNLIQPLPELEKSLKGKLERITVHGTSLEGNLEGDSADRDVFVYLPPSYAREPNRRYPVVYTLHGYGRMPSLSTMAASIPIPRPPAIGKRSSLWNWCTI